MNLKIMEYYALYMCESRKYQSFPGSQINQILILYHLSQAPSSVPITKQKSLTPPRYHVFLSLGLLAESRCDHCIAKRNRSPSPKQKGAGKKALALSKCGIASSKRLERRNQESSVCNELEWFLRFTSDTVNHDPDLSSLLYGIHPSFRSNFD